MGTLFPIIDDFRGMYRWLSNFHECEIHYEGIVYPSTEHAYQAAKTLDLQDRKRISNLSTPVLAKREGGKLSLREDWEEIKVKVMRDVIWDKFTRNVDLKEKLLATKGTMLIEGNTWNDQFWGVCRGNGRNVLGSILMIVRKELELT